MDKNLIEFYSVVEAVFLIKNMYNLRRQLPSYISFIILFL